MHNDTTERFAAFKPEERREVPMRPIVPVKTEKKDMAFVDTLAMQTKLGTKNRQTEESLPMNVTARPVIPQGFEGAAGSIRIMGNTPPPILDLAANMRRRGSQEVDMRQSPPPPGYVQEAPKPQKVMGSGRSVVIVAQPLPGEVREAPLVQPIVSDRVRAQIQDKIVAEMKERGMAVAQPPVVAVVAAEVPPAPAAPEPPAPKPEPVVVESTPFVDQSEQIAELEAENAALLGIVTRLAAENKALKAKK